MNPTQLASLARSHTDSAIKTLAAIMTSEGCPAAARVRAAGNEDLGRRQVLGGDMIPADDLTERPPQRSAEVPPDLLPLLSSHGFLPRGPPAGPPGASRSDKRVVVTVAGLPGHPDIDTLS
jgi:hypothetical protein